MIKITKLLDELKDLRHEYKHAKFGSKIAQIKDEVTKQEKLLELYQKYFRLNDINVIQGGHSYGNSKNTQESIKVINQIKELEK